MSVGVSSNLVPWKVVWSALSSDTLTISSGVAYGQNESFAGTLDNGRAFNLGRGFGKRVILCHRVGRCDWHNNLWRGHEPDCLRNLNRLTVGTTLSAIVYGNVTGPVSAGGDIGSVYAGLEVHGSLNGSVNSATGFVNVYVVGDILGDIHASTGIVAELGGSVALFGPYHVSVIAANLYTVTGDVVAETFAPSPGPVYSGGASIAGNITTGNGDISVYSDGGSVSGTISTSAGNINIYAGKTIAGVIQTLDGNIGSVQRQGRHHRIYFGLRIKLWPNLHDWFGFRIGQRRDLRAER